jgi:exopolysaccharide biosynthesis polyprenyl glycosylphosphotransferase
MPTRDAAFAEPECVRQASAPTVSRYLAQPRAARRLSSVVAADLIALADFLAVVIGAMAVAAFDRALLGADSDGTLTLRTAVIAGGFALLTLKSLGSYEPSRVCNGSIDVENLVVGLVVGVTGAFGVGLTAPAAAAHVAVWYLCWLSASAALIFANRAISSRWIANAARAGRFNQRIAIYGAGAVAQRVYGHLHMPADNIELIGVFDDRSNRQCAAPDDRRESHAAPLAGDCAALVKLCREGRVDRIIVALPPSADVRIAAILEKFDRLPVSTHVVTHIASDVLDYEQRAEVSTLGPVGLLDVKKKPLRDWAPVVKRLEDVCLASLILIVSAPFWPLIARRGRHQSIIQIWKFRTMTAIERGANVRQAVEGDARVTRIGRLLRRTSLDELPQLINVVRGEMSLVGPRPHALVHDQEFTRALELYPDRHQMRPGMTGLAQISGLRGPTSKPGTIEARVEADLAYIRRWSIWLDLKILALTFTAVVRGENANRP